MACGLLYDHQHSRAGHWTVFHHAAQRQKRDGIRYQIKCVAQTLHCYVRIALSAGKAVPHDRGLSIIGVRATEYISGNQLA